MKPTMPSQCHIARRPLAALQRAFTLIEVMIVVAIVAILAAIAIPSYNEYIIRGRLVEMTNAMTTLQGDLQRYFNDNRTFANLPAPVVWPCTAPPSVANRYTLACVNIPAAAPQPERFLITGTGAATGPLNGFTFTLDSRGMQSTTAAPTGWVGAALPIARWCTKKGDC